MKRSLFPSFLFDRKLISPGGGGGEEEREKARPGWERAQQKVNWYATAAAAAGVS
jgi:hypothetical protein